MKAQHLTLGWASEREVLAVDLSENEIEDVVFSAWQTFIGDEVTENDNFFVKGGTSLAAVQVSMTISKQLGVTIKPGVLFESSSFQTYLKSVVEIFHGDRLNQPSAL